MTTDETVSIRFDMLPAGKGFTWLRSPFEKISQSHATDRHGDVFWFPDDCKVDVSYTSAKSILGEPTEPGVWD